MALAKMQTPTTRIPKEEAKENAAPMDSVQYGSNGDVVVTRVDFKPTSSRRERFGAGTKGWAQFNYDEEPLQEFYR